MIDDLKAGLRSLRRRPASSGIAIVILALGLSSSVGVFTYVNGFNQPFPGADPDGLTFVHGIENDVPFAGLSYLDYLDYERETDRVFSAVSAVQTSYAASIRHDASTEVVFLEAVSGNFFDVLGIEMSAGRALTPSDDQPGAAPAAVISHAWWQRQWNGDASVLGSVVAFNSRPHTIVGVASPEFRGSLASMRPDAWLPFEPFKARYTGWATAADDRDAPLVRVHARLRDGVTKREARDELTRIASGLDEAYPRQSGDQRRLGVMGATWIDPNARLREQDTVRMMIAAAAGLLLLVCANVGNLLLAIATGRRREMAMRAAAGASRLRLVRQVIAETLVLSTLATLGALAFATPLSARLGSYFASPSVWGANVARHAAVDGRVVLFAFGIAVVTGLAAGLLPTLSVFRTDLARLLSERAGAPGRRILGRRAPSSREALVSAQIGLAVVLLVLSGLVLRSLDQARSIDPGFESDRLVASYISTSSTGVQVSERDLYFRTLARRLEEEPWVRSATIADAALLSPHASADFRFEGYPDDVRIVTSKVIPGYFASVGIGVERGRAFAEGDTLGAPEVAMLNEAAEARFFPAGGAVGGRVRRVTAGGAGAPAGVAGAGGAGLEIVGIAADARVRDFLADPEPVIYVSNPQQSYASGSSLMVATVDDPTLAVDRIRRWLVDYESHIAIVNVLPYTDVIRGFTYAQRMNAEMFTLLAVLGLTLATLGIFSVMSLAVTHRSREIGVRMAIGARGSDIGRLMAGRISGSIATGLIAGVLGAAFLARLAGGLLYEVRPLDSPSIVGAVVVLMGGALAAAALPAYRAASVDPSRSLRIE